MNETSRPQGGPPRPLPSVPAARDVLARVVAAREELTCDPLQAEVILADLEADLASRTEEVS